MSKTQLKQVRKERGYTIRQMAEATGLSQGYLSKIENGEWPAKLDDVIKLAESYRVDAQGLVREWMFSHAEHPKTLDTLSVLLSSESKKDLTADDVKVHEMIKSLNADLGMRKVIRNVLDTLYDLQKSRNPRRDLGGQTLFLDDLVNESEYQPIIAGSRISRRHVTSTSKPARFLLEIHRIPARYGGYHRQALVGASQPGREFWCILLGTAKLLVRNRRTGWRCDEVGRSDCGFYGGGQDHVWLNVSRDEPLLIFAGFFPHSEITVHSPAVGTDGDPLIQPGAWCEFELTDIPEKLPTDVRSEIGHALSSRRKRN